MDSKSYLVSGGTKDRRVKEVLKLIAGLNPEINDFTPRPDFFILEGETSIGIDMVRDLQQKISLKAWSSSYKIALIRKAQILTIEAQNALLKTLEEPPNSTILILETEEVELLLPTIVSRCLVVSLNRVVEKDFLTSKLQKKVLSDLIFLLSAKISQKFEFATNLVSQKTSPEWLTIQTILWRDLLLIKLNCTKYLLIKIYDKKMYSFINKLEVLTIKKFLGKIETARKELEANINERLVMENLLLEMPAV